MIFALIYLLSGVMAVIFILFIICLIFFAPVDDETYNVIADKVIVATIVIIGVPLLSMMLRSVFGTGHRSGARCAQAFNCKCNNGMCDCLYLNNSKGQNTTENVKCPADK